MNIVQVRAYLVRCARSAGSHEPEDVAHDVIERVLRHRHGFDHPKAYWHRAAHNQALNQQRDTKPANPLDDYVTEMLVAPPEVIPVPLRDRVPTKLKADVDLLVKWYTPEWRKRLSAKLSGALRQKLHRARGRVREALR